MTKLTVTREIAYDAFIEVLEQKRDPDEVVLGLSTLSQEPLKKLDHAFIKEILYGGLRWYSKILWILQKTSSRDLGSVSRQVEAALVLGAYQIFYMDRVPDRAAVNESVEYVRKKGQPNAANFINGILRAIARRSEYFAKPDKDRQPCEYLALQYAHPKWIVERWLRRFHFEKLKDLLAANNQHPPYSIRLNAKKVPLDNTQEFRSGLLRDEKNHSDRCPLRSCLKLKESPWLSEGSLFSQGFFTIQDEASQLIGGLVAPNTGEFIIDACSGPGGKTTHIWELADGPIELVGVERNPKQIEKAKANATRLGHAGIQWVEKDFLAFESPKLADRILLDAPCSGLGVLRRHPEGKWLKTPKLLRDLPLVQKHLIEHAWTLLKPGGELIYSVCSFEPEESLNHLNWLKEHFKDKMELISPVSRLPDYYKRFVTRDNMLMIYSGNQDGMDGFAAFLIKKIS